MREGMPAYHPAEQPERRDDEVTMPQSGEHEASAPSSPIDDESDFPESGERMRQTQFADTQELLAQAYATNPKLHPDHPTNNARRNAPPTAEELKRTAAVMKTTLADRARKLWRKLTGTEARDATALKNRDVPAASEIRKK